jgi:hypothetical protein
VNDGVSECGGSDHTRQAGALSISWWIALHRSFSARDRRSATWQGSACLSREQQEVHAASRAMDRTRSEKRGARAVG